MGFRLRFESRVSVPQISDWTLPKDEKETGVAVVSPTNRPIPAQDTVAHDNSSVIEHKFRLIFSFKKANSGLWGILSIVVYSGSNTYIDGTGDREWVLLAEESGYFSAFGQSGMADRFDIYSQENEGGGLSDQVIQK